MLLMYLRRLTTINMAGPTATNSKARRGTWLRLMSKVHTHLQKQSKLLYAALSGVVIPCACRSQASVRGSCSAPK
jgi:hypothetical protein